MVDAMVVTVEDMETESTCPVSLMEFLDDERLKNLKGNEVIFENAKGEIFKGKVIEIEDGTFFPIVKWEDSGLLSGLGQSSKITIKE